jgi:hypothetical protein
VVGLELGEVRRNLHGAFGRRNRCRRRLLLAVLLLLLALVFLALFAL